MTLTHRLIFIDEGINKNHVNPSNPSMNSSVSETNPQKPLKKRFFNFLDQVIFRVEFTKEIDHS